MFKENSAGIELNQNTEEEDHSFEGNKRQIPRCTSRPILTERKSSKPIKMDKLNKRIERAMASTINGLGL